MTPDFVRIANEEGYSVQTGHQLLALSLPLEFREIASVYELSRGQKWKPKEMMAQLNEMPERCFGLTGHVRIIGWGQWANFFQKHVCHAIRHNFDFMQIRWGVPEEAGKFSIECNEQFRGLRLYPFVRALNSLEPQSYRSAADDCSRVIMATPQLVPGKCWNKLCFPTELTASHPPNIKLWMNWYKNNFPAGTAYDSVPHIDNPDFCLSSNSPELTRRALHVIAPYDRQITYRIFRYEYHEHPTCEQAEALYQAVLPYATYAMVRQAEIVADQPARYERLMSQAAGLDPARYFNLGDYFKERQQDDKAAGYFEKGNELDPDSVRASYYASWLIKYYLKKGDVGKAQSVADTAGEVYSSVGLGAKAEFFEATGKYNEAFEWYSKIEERYDDAGPVESFCMRYKTKTGDTRFDSYLQQRAAKLFPQGTEHVSLASFVDPPADGVLIAEQNDLVRAAGLKTGDVIVAVYGIRVHNFPQYSNARESTSEPELDLIVWQGNHYREIKLNLPGHRFGVEFASYRSQ
jgi:tetratricopeptide (TPR) repeat protein